MVQLLLGSTSYTFIPLSMSDEVWNKHGVFVLLPWDLDKLDLETANSTFYLIEVFLHPFTLAFVTTVDLTGYDLRVVVYDHILNLCCSCRSNPAIKASYSASLLMV